MERWLNSRGARIAAWLCAGVLAAGAAGFALFLLLPAGSGAATGDDTRTALPAVTVVPVAAAAPTPGRTTFSGTLARVEGQALVVSLGGESVRVLLRSGAPIGVVALAGTGDIRAGEPVTAVVTHQAGRLVATRVRLQPPEVPSLFPGSDRPRSGGSLDPLVVTGTVAAMEASHLRIATARGERRLEINSPTRITRFTPITPADLRTGQRVTIDGERLVDGSVAATSVQVFDPR